MAWWIWDCLGGMVAASVAGLLTARHEARVRADWEAVGLRRGSPVAAVIGQAIVFGCAGFALVNAVDMWLTH